VKLRSASMLSALLVISACATFSSGPSLEERIFQEPVYVEAARAAGRGDVATLRRLIQGGVDPNHEGAEVMTPYGKDTFTLLMWAAEKDQVESVQALLEAGADPNRATRRGAVPLLLAAVSRKDELSEVLLRAGADPNRVLDSYPPRTPLIAALGAPEGRLENHGFARAEALVRHGADVNLDLGRGETAAIFFSSHDDWRIVYWLLEHGANPEAGRGGRVVCILRNSYNPDVLRWSSAKYRDKVRDWLLAHGIARSKIDPAFHPSRKCDD
jgi:ankyrin repeat protein